MINLIDVTLRDGISRYGKFIPTNKKIHLAKLIFEAGFKKVEVTTIKPNNPQFSDAKKVVDGLGHYSQKIRILCFKFKDIEKIKNYNVAEIVFNVGATDNYEKKYNRTTQGAIQEALKSFKVVKKAGKDFGVDVGCAFGDSTQKDFKLDNILSVIDTLINAGVDRITLADTYGNANSRVIKQFYDYLNKKYTNVIFPLHFHGKNALKNLKSAYKAGARSFEVSFHNKNFLDERPNMDALETIKFFEDQNEKLEISKEKIGRIIHFYNNMI